MDTSINRKQDNNFSYSIDVSIVIVNFNTYELTCECIKSVMQFTTGINFEIILVDNASTECDAHKFEDEFPSVKLVISKENGGFSKGNNLGIRLARGKYVLLLNSDTKLLNNALKLSFDLMENDLEVGVLGAQLINPRNIIQKSSRKFRSISWELLEIFPIHYLFPKQRQEKIMLHHYFGHKRAMEVDWISGAFMFFRKSVIDKMPGKILAEDYFMYCEDVLWCWRVKELGYKVIFNPMPRVFHLHHASTKKLKKKKLRKTIVKNHLDFMKRYYYPNWKYYVFAPIYIIKQRLIGWIE